MGKKRKPKTKQVTSASIESEQQIEAVEAEELFYPGVKCYPDPDHEGDMSSWEGDILSLRESREDRDKIHDNAWKGDRFDYSAINKAEDAIIKQLKYDLKNPKERVLFEDMMNELGIPLDIFQHRKLDNVREALRIDDTDGYEFELLGIGQNWDKDYWMFRHAPIIIAYIKPVLREIEHDGAMVHVKDFQARTVHLPLDNDNNLCFPLVIWMEDSVRYSDGNYDHSYRIYETAEDFRQKFPEDLAWMHDKGYRVVYFEDDGAEYIGTESHISECLSENAVQWLHELGMDTRAIDSSESRYLEISRDDKFCEVYCERYQACIEEDHPTKPEYLKYCKTPEAIKNHKQYIFMKQCPKFKEFVEAWKAEFQRVVITPEAEAAWTKKIDALNRFRPKGTHFIRYYTINVKKYPKAWGDDPTYDDIAAGESERYSISQMEIDWPNAWAYFQCELANATFTFTDEQAFDIMLQTDHLQWETRINAYRRNQLVGIAQDKVGAEQKPPVTAMTISKWVKAVRGEISRIRGERYELFLDAAWKRSGEYASITHDGTESKPDFVRVPFDGVPEIVSTKCFNHPRNTISIPLSDIKPELDRAKEMRATGKAVKLIVHVHNQATNYTEERTLDFSNMPDPITITENA